jgi:hypothetical protein
MTKKVERPASTPTKEREGVKRMTMRPRKGGSVTKPKGGDHAKVS